MKNSTQPIIVIGSHRSGTTMIVRILQELGLFIGRDLEENYESRFFYERHEKILSASNGSWDNPVVIENLINNAGLREKVREALVLDLSSFRIAPYLGLQYYFKYRSLKKLDFPWGWKDPRNTFFLPLWLDIFPKAKIVHIYRNGIDVAQSLMIREYNRINSILNGDLKFSTPLSQQISQIKRDGPFFYLVKKLQNRHRKMSFLHKYDTLGIHSCISLEKGFKLWCAYVEKALEHLEKFENDVLTIKYEDFLINPKDHIQELMDFCNVWDADQTLEIIIRGLDKTRGHAFKNSTSLKRFYESVKDNYLLKKLGYIYDENF